MQACESGVPPVAPGHEAFEPPMSDGTVVPFSVVGLEPEPEDVDEHAALVTAATSRIETMRMARR
jgi:hypothetical protein